MVLSSVTSDGLGSTLCFTNTMRSSATWLYLTGACPVVDSLFGPQVFQLRSSPETPPLSQNV